MGPLGGPPSGIHLGEIEPRRRSVQSYVQIRALSLDESGSPAAVNNSFLSFRIRDKKPQG